MARTYQNAASRWAGVGPYYAMFPVSFADEVIQTYTRPGDLILDPFAGRGTAVFSAATQEREAIGVEINPVGFVYAKTKLNPADRAPVELRLLEVGELAPLFRYDAERLPHFFHRCFGPRVRRFLVAARAELNWRRSKTDRTLMALVLVYLHGKAGTALSNQMRQTKAMSPQYAVRWWDEHRFEPPDLDPVAFMRARLQWRYAKGIPDATGGRIYLGNSSVKLRTLSRHVQEGSLATANLLFTSPPYHAVTNYHYDQWLRLWLLGGPPNALRNGNGRSGKFEGRRGYRSLLTQVFKRSAQLLAKDATVYVRTDSRAFTYRTTLDVLQELFPEKRLVQERRPMIGASQTRLFGTGGTPAGGDGEVDLILSPR